MLPADQRFGAGHATVRQPDLRLQIHPELAVLDRRTHLRHEGQELRLVPVDHLVVDLEADARFLRRVHRDVCMTEQQVGVLGVRRVQRDPDAAGDIEIELLDTDRPAEAFDDTAPRRRQAVSSSGRSARSTPNSSPPSRGHQVAVAQRLRDPRPDRREQLVAEVVSEGVVDLLEVIEVHQHHADLAARLLGFRDRLHEAPLEEQPVREVGEVVVQRLILVLRLLVSELLGRELQGMRPVQHLPREGEGRDEDRRCSRDRLSRVVVATNRLNSARPR